MRSASKLAVLVAFAATAPVGSLTAQAPAHEAPPAAAAPKNFALPPRKELTLPGGMHATIVSYGNLPMARVALIVRTGAIDEGPDQVWLSKLMGDFLQQGTTSHSATALAETVAGMGGELGVTALDDNMNIGGEVLGDSAAAFVRIVGDVARHPSFPDSELARLKGDKARDLAIARTNPQQIARERYAALNYPDHPYGRVYPTTEALGGYTTAQVRDFYRHNFGAARAHLYVIGKFDEATVERAVRETFTGWAAGLPPTVNVPKTHASKRVALLDRPGAVQSTIIIGLPVADPSSPDWIPLQVTDALLGGSFGSRITSNIREAKGYTYSPFSSIDPRYRVAIWSEGADVTTNVTGASIKEIVGEIDRLRDTAPPAAELTGIQNYLAGLYVLRSSTLPGLLGQFAFVDLHGLGDTYLSNYVHRVHEVTPAQVQGMAKKYLDPNLMTTVVAGDMKTVAPQLVPYGPVIQ